MKSNFGLFRCLYAGNWPVCKLPTGNFDYDKMLSLTINILEETCKSEEDFIKIFRENSLKFYNLYN